MTDLDSFTALLTPEGRALLDAVAGHDPADELATATRLRRDHPAPLVSAALGQARLRQRAAVKFGADAARMFFTPHGVEQATRTEVAAHRAARIAALGVRSVADLCCGIGGDAVALARAGVRVLAVDRDPVTAAVARANAEALGLAELIEVREAEVAEVEVGGYDAVFVDPARRGGRGGRVFDPEAYSPPLSWAVEAALRAPVAALKIAPGVPHEAIPPQAEAEWISYGGDVKEAVLWFGGAGAPEGVRPAPGSVRATLLPAGEQLWSPEPPPDVAGGPGRPVPLRAGRRGDPRAPGGGGGRAGRRPPGRRDDRLRHLGQPAPDAVRRRVRDHGCPAVQPQEAEGAAAGA